MARGQIEADNNTHLCALTNMIADLYISLKIGLIGQGDVPFHWHKYIIAWDVGLRERELDAIKKDEGGYTNGGKVASPSRANEIVRRLQEEQGARR